MTYERMNLQDGDTVEAYHATHIEDELEALDNETEKLSNSLADFSIVLGRYSSLDDDNIGQAVMDFNAKLADGQFGAGYANLQGTIIIIFGTRYNESRGRYIVQSSTTNSIYTVRITGTESCIVCSIQISSTTDVG